MKNDLISIIIPVYNSASTLEACIESVVKQKYPKDKIEIFLIDNGSSDNSFEVFRKIHKQRTMIKSSLNLFKNVSYMSI